MNGTPRLRSAYPQTPKSSRRNAASFEGLKSSPDKSKAATRSKSHGRGDDANAPLVPLSVIDGPTQRLYVSAFYILLTAWRLYDYYTLISNGTDSLWFFMKWVALDGVFLYGLPGLRIPWLEWSSSTITAVFLFHAIVNAVLMFRIPVSTISTLIFLHLRGTNVNARYLLEHGLSLS